MSEVNWYVVHTYSGYENKVKANIEKTIENRHLEDQILEVRVPMEEVVEVKNGTKNGFLWKTLWRCVMVFPSRSREKCSQAMFLSTWS